MALHDARTLSALPMATSGGRARGIRRFLCRSAFLIVASCVGAALYCWWTPGPFGIGDETSGELLSDDEELYVPLESPGFLLGLAQLLYQFSDIVFGPPPSPALWTDVFTLGEGGQTMCYRIPTIIQTSSGLLLAFAERRYGGCGDDGKHDLVLKNSSDGGTTWGELIKVVDGHGKPISNPNPVEVKMNDGTKAILLHYDTMNNPKTTSHGRNMQIWSYDEGLTWQDAEDITSVMPRGMAGCMPGPSVGVQTRDGSIFFTCHMTGSGLLYWSENLGKNWTTSKAIPGLDECSLAVLPNSSLAENCRTKHNKRKALTWSVNGELLHPPVYARNSTDANCQGSIIAIGDTLLMSNVGDDELKRANLTVKYSKDDGLSWKYGGTAHIGPSAYSQLIQLKGLEAESYWLPPAVELGILAEIGKRHPSERIGFRRATLPTGLSNSMATKFLRTWSESCVVVFFLFFCRIGFRRVCLRGELSAGLANKLRTWRSSREAADATDVNAAGQENPQPGFQELTDDHVA